MAVTLSRDALLWTVLRGAYNIAESFDLYAVCVSLLTLPPSWKFGDKGSVKIREC